MSTHANDMAVQCELSTFLLLLSEDRMRISACGLFHVGKHLLPGVSVESELECL